MGRDSNPLRAFSREQPRVQVPTWLPTAWWMEADRYGCHVPSECTQRLVPDLPGRG